jgi:hypothetical protein
MLWSGIATLRFWRLVTMPDTAVIDLNIRGENVQELYSWYLEGRLVVNRRYQRKLVWTKEEKAQLIDTMRKRFPLPLILLAEVEFKGTTRFEIIDGMQRLNAIFSFIENQFDISEGYFDLETMASTKELLDAGKLKQKRPKLERTFCSQLANYKIPISTYRIDDKEHIDEIFRRINSNGRHLSNQEIRQAGVTGQFADVVREYATAIRGDVSHDLVLPLNDMHKISITNKDLEYGVKVEDIFWVKHGVFRKEDIRGSKDEDLVADLVSYIVSSPGDKPGGSSERLDSYYGHPSNSSEEARKRAEDKKLQMDTLVAKAGPNVVLQNMIRTHDVIVEVLTSASTTFRGLIRRSGTKDRVPRYYQIVFWAFYELVIEDRKKIADINGLMKALSGIEDHIKINSGGNWPANNRSANVKKVKAILSDFFKVDPSDPSVLPGITVVDNLLTRSSSEASSYDFKQGFHRLDHTKAFDSVAFDGFLADICAMANLGKEKTGYLVMGIANKEADALRIEHLYGTKPVKAGEFYVTGVDGEAGQYGGVEKYLHFLATRLSASGLSSEIRNKVTSSLSSVSYYGRTVVIVEVKAGQEPCVVGGNVYKRSGPATIHVTDGKEILKLGKLFI